VGSASPASAHSAAEFAPVALRARGVHLLEPDGWKLAGGIDDGVFRAIVARLVGVGQRRLPERADG